MRGLILTSEERLHLLDDVLVNIMLCSRYHIELIAKFVNKQQAELCPLLLLDLLAVLILGRLLRYGTVHDRLANI